MKLELKSFLIFRNNVLMKQDKLLIDIVVVVDQKLITANALMNEPGVCIVLRHSPVDQFHNLIV